MRNRLQEAKAMRSNTLTFVMPSSKGPYAHLGGSMMGGVGDPASYYPNMWAWAVAMLGVKSVIDIGCGQGHSLKYFADLGCRARGVEGFEPSIRDGCRPELVIHHDYEKAPLKLDEEFDMAWCCEFLEHVEADKMDNYFATFASAKMIFATHAVPGQGGHHHVNEQPTEYWLDAFDKRGFRFDSDLTGCARLIAQADNFVFKPQQKPYFIATGMVFFNNEFMPLAPKAPQN
jgi:SAM-dependent methyltransferase